MYLTRLVVGDWSGDGHSQMKEFIVASTLDSFSIKTIVASEALNSIFDTRYVCAEYEENTLSLEVVEKLESLGYNFEREDDENVSTDPEEYANIIVFLLRYLCPEHKFDILKITDVNVGGYGLFH